MSRPTARLPGTCLVGSRAMRSQPSSGRADESGQEIFQTLRIHVKGADVSRPARAAGVWRVIRLQAMMGCSGWEGRSCQRHAQSAGQEIHPPNGAIPAARLTPGDAKGSEPPLVRHLGGTIGDVAVGGGGRFLLCGS